MNKKRILLEIDEKKERKKINQIIRIDYKKFNYLVN